MKMKQQIGELVMVFIFAIIAVSFVIATLGATYG